MDKRFIPYLVFFLLLFAGQLVAIPFTSPGMINTPTAYVLPHYMVEAAWISYMTSYDNDAKEMGYDFDFAMCGTVGLLNKAEIGIVGTAGAVYFANFKYNIFSESTGIPAITIGCDNLGSGVKDTREKDKGRNETDNGEYDLLDPDELIENSFYGVISKTFDFDKVTLSAHLGAGVGHFLHLVEDDDKLSGGYFGGVEVSFLTFLTAKLEYDGGTLNGAVGVNINNFTVQTAVTQVDNYNNINIPKFGVNLKYVFDDYAQEKFEGRSSGSNTIKATPGDRYYRQSRQSEDAAILEELRKMRERREKVDKDIEDFKRELKDTDNE